MSGKQWRWLKKRAQVLHGWGVSRGYFAPEGFYLLIGGVGEGLGFEEEELEPKEENGTGTKRK